MQGFSDRRKELLAAGASKKSSWDQAAAEFGFRAGSSAATLVAELPEAPPGIFAGKTSSVEEDTQWVYHNLGDEDVRPEQAPSAGAWGLLKWAMENQDAFYREWLKLSAEVGREERARGEVMVETERQADEILAMLDQMRERAIEQGIAEREAWKRESTIHEEY